MALPEEINKSLMAYDLKKGLLRRLLGDQSGIKALRNLSLTDQNNFFRLYGCFSNNNRPKPNQASYQVYKAVLRGFLEHLGLTQTSIKQTTGYSKNLEYMDLAFLTAKQTLISDNNLLVGLLHWDTSNKQTLVITERNELLKAAVQSLIMQAKGQQCVLVAPEYFYSRPIADHSERYLKNVNHIEDFLNYIPIEFQREYATSKHYYPGSIIQLEESQYEEILAFLKDLSIQYPNLVLFPGTIAYRKTIKKEDLAKLKERIEANIGNISSNYPSPILLVNHGNVEFHFGPERSNKQKNEFLAKFKYYAVNTAPCFYQGQQVFSQDKVYNCLEILEGFPDKISAMCSSSKYYPETIFQPGKYEGKIAKINELSFAVDICIDQYYKYLKNSLAKNQEQPMLHICESAYLKAKLTAQCQAIGGYFLHASSKLEHTLVIKREQAFVYEKIAPYQSEEISVCNKYKGKSTLRFFKLPWTISNKEPVIPGPERRMSI